MSQVQLADAFPCLTDDLQRVEKALTPTPWKEDRLDLTKMVGHLMGGVPKLVRPTLVLTSAYLGTAPLRPVSDRVIEAAVAIEHVHVGAMCHDDVMDEADARRARASVNARWGNAMAILCGDFHLASAAEIAARLGPSACDVIAKTFKALCGGQMIETADLYSTTRTEEDYERAIVGKTATLLSSSCRMGAIHSGADRATVDALARFGMEFGVAFQIHDDVLDLTETAEALGKPAANDVLKGVYTLPVIRALRHRAELRDLLQAPVSPADAALARDIVVSSGALEEAASVGCRRFQSAVEALETLGGGSPPVKALVAYAEEMLPAFGAPASRTA